MFSSNPIYLGRLLDGDWNSRCPEAFALPRLLGGSSPLKPCTITLFWSNLTDACFDALDVGCTVLCVGVTLRTFGLWRRGERLGVVLLTDPAANSSTRTGTSAYLSFCSLILGERRGGGLRRGDRLSLGVLLFILI